MLQIEIVKRPDGGGVLRCTRADGSVTWQKQTVRHAVHFTLHDLTHYAVETVLGNRQGMFDAERASGALWRASEFSAFAGLTLTESQVATIRARRAELFRRWFALRSGESLLLQFP